MIMMQNGKKESAPSAILSPMKTAGHYSLIDFGAAGDGKTDCSRAFTDAADRIKEEGGGTIYVPPGVYLTGPVQLFSNTELYLAPGAVVRFSDNPEDYPLVSTRWGGNDCVTLMPMLYADGEENISLAGKGTLDGNGMWWWKTYLTMAKAEKPSDEWPRSFREMPGAGIFPEDWPHLAELEKTMIRVITANGDMARYDTGGGGMESGFLRPPLLQFKDCRNITIEGVTCTNSAFWNCHMLYSTDITIHDARFVSPADAPNTDGMDIDSCCGVRISDCVYDVGDDCLCLKSGIGKDAMAVGRPTEEVVISNCTMLRGHGGIVLGSEIAGGLKNIVISGCTFRGTDRGIRLKTRRKRGGYVKNVRISDIVMSGVGCPLVFNMYYKCGTHPDQIAYLSDKNPQPLTDTTPFMENVSISGIISTETRAAAGIFLGLPERPITGVSISDTIIDMAENADPEEPAMTYFVEKFAAAGFVLENLKDSRISGCRVSGVKGEPVRMTNCEDVSIS